MEGSGGIFTELQTASLVPCIGRYTWGVFKAPWLQKKLPGCSNGCLSFWCLVCPTSLFPLLLITQSSFLWRNSLIPWSSPSPNLNFLVKNGLAISLAARMTWAHDSRWFSQAFPQDHSCEEGPSSLWGHVSWKIVTLELLLDIFLPCREVCPQWEKYRHKKSNDVSDRWRENLNTSQCRFTHSSYSSSSIPWSIPGSFW